MVGVHALTEEPANPSDWSKRWPGAAVALAGFGIALYLALYQLGVVASVWEPLFGQGSRIILKESVVARFLPIPDAALGVCAYLVEVILEVSGGRRRWQTMPWVVLLLGAASAALGLTAIGLVCAQAFIFRAGCTLCLASALCSFTLCWLVWPEVRAGWRHLRQKHKQGHSLWDALTGQAT